MNAATSARFLARMWVAGKSGLQPFDKKAPFLKRGFFSFKPWGLDAGMAASVVQDQVVAVNDFGFVDVAEDGFELGG